MANGDDTALLDPRPTPGAPGLTPGAGMALANPPADQDAADRAQQRAERAQALQDLRAAQAEEMRLARARQKEMAPLYSDYATQLKQFGRTSEQQTQSLIAGRKDIPEYQPEDMRTAASAWMMAASLFGALAGGLGRRHISDGLAAYTGMLEGFNKGSIAATEQNYKTWQANADRAIEYKVVGCRSSRSGRAELVPLCADRDSLIAHALRWVDATLLLYDSRHPAAPDDVPVIAL